MAIFHLVGIPIVTARALQAPVLEVVRPCVRPLLVAAVPAPLLVVADGMIDRWTLVTLLAVVGGYACLVGVGAAAFAVSAAERRRITAALRKRIRRA
jgi:hypothetical protein